LAKVSNSFVYVEYVCWFAYFFLDFQLG
jgi:hypothetical protein